MPDPGTMDVLSKAFLEKVFRSAVAAVEPGLLVRKGLDGADAEGFRRVYLAGGGKAAVTMGEAALAILGSGVAAGLLAVPAGRGGVLGPVRLIPAGHPLPDVGSRRAAEAMLGLLAGAGEGDLVIALISGGGSAMISAPSDGISPSDKEAVVRLLLRSGADIAELNTVRKHLSRVKGGLLARAAHPARVLALLLSDVPGDDPSVIASGPFSPDPTTFGDAVNVLAGRRIDRGVPPAVRAYLASGLAGAVRETPKPGDPAFERVSCRLIGSNTTALDAAAAALKKAGAEEIRVLPGFLRGEARECARSFAARLKEARAAAGPGRAVFLVAGGETTVTVAAGGKGGRCQEFALAAALEIEGEKGMALLAAGTDGIDGPTDAAGAYASGSTCARARATGTSPRAHLDGNDAYALFAALGDLFRPGPTGTNVADLAIGAAVPGPP